MADPSYYEWVLLNDEDCTEAGGITPDFAASHREAQHYLSQYGPGHRFEVRRVTPIATGSWPKN